MVSTHANPDKSAAAKAVAPRRSTLDWALEGVALLALLTAVAVVAIHWRDLPETVPNGYGLTGSPTAWSDKNHLWKVVRDAAGFWALFTVIALPLGSVARRVPEVLPLIRRQLLVFKTVMMLFFAHLIWSSVNVALGRAQGIEPAFDLAVVLAATLTVIVYTVKIARRIALRPRV
jgi:hypothetical protein